MPSEAGEKRYYLKQAGRITGPFPMLKLTGMYQSGALSCEDMYSEDKHKWHYINALFPALAPKQPLVIESAAPQDESLPAAVYVGRDETSAATGGNAPSAAPQPENPTFPEPLPPFREWVADIGRTIALLWNFQEMLRTHAGKSGRFFGIASVINVILALLFVLLFGKFYSARFHYFFSAVMGISLMAMLWGVAALIGWLAAEFGTPRGQKTSGTWKICAAGIFMNYGTLAGCVLALNYGISRHLWVGLLLVFIDSFVLCSSAMQLRDYLTEVGRPWRPAVLCCVLLLNPLLAAGIYGFTTLI